MNIIEDIKKTMTASYDNLDDVLQVIVSETEQELKLLLHLKNNEEIPENLSFIVKNVSRKRFNRLGAEGMTSQITEGLSLHYSASNDFKEYLSIINNFIDVSDRFSKYAKIEVF